MNHILNYFDLNKRMIGGIAEKSDEIIDPSYIIENTEEKPITESITKSTEEKSDLIPESPDSTQSAHTPTPPSSTSDDEDPLYNDMEKYWAERDLDTAKPEKFSPKKVLQSFISTLSFKRKFLSFKLKSISSIPWWQQIALYSSIIIGATLSSFVIEYQADTRFLFEFSLSFVLLSSTVAIIICPVALEKLCMDISGSFFTRLFLFIQYGGFWYILTTLFYFAIS